ncbi:MAG: gephyrin-like molybdotransferase Glp [Candidatus Limnocylindrales bacterium]
MSIDAPLLPLEAARDRMLAALEPLGVEAVDVEAAVGRVVAAPVVARVTMPPWANSAMDGFAVRTADVAVASAARPVELLVVGEVSAGHAPPGRVSAGSTMRILTGAMVPEGADAIVPVEQTDAAWGVAELPTRVGIRAAVRSGDHIRAAGSDITAGQALADVGQVVHPATVGVLIAAGHRDVVVFRRPRVTVISTGDELVAPGRPLGPGQIHDSNGPMLAALAADAGATTERVTAVTDDLATVARTLETAIARSDVVLTSGGVSLGAHDVVRVALAARGRLEVWRVAVQPGKPLAFARATAASPDDAREVLLFGLPGNPVSSFVTFELFVRPVLRRLGGQRDPTGRPVRRVRLAEAVSKHDERRAFLRVTLHPDPDRPGHQVARLAGGQGSHVLSALAAADALAVVPEAVRDLPAGAEIEVWPLYPEGS